MKIDGEKIKWNATDLNSFVSQMYSLIFLNLPTDCGIKFYWDERYILHLMIFCNLNRDYHFFLP